MDPRYEQSALETDERLWWYRGRRRIVMEVIRSLPLPRPARVLDAGCGSGRTMEELATLGEAVGLEPSPASLEVARSRGVGEVVEGSLSAAPFADHSFDLATALDVIEHIDDDRGALAELRRVVRPGGFLVVTVPAYPSLWGPHDVANQHRRRYTRAGLLDAARSAGWQPVRTTHFNSILLPPAAAVRRLRQLLPQDGAEARSELNLTPAWLDDLLERPMRAEARLIATGRRIPAGLSLLAVLTWRAARTPPSPPRA